MKKLIQILLLLCLAKTAQAYTTTAKIWSDGSRIYASVTASKDATMSIHSFKSKATLRSPNGRIATIETPWKYDQNAVAMVSLSFLDSDPGEYTVDGVTNLYCPKGIYTATQTKQAKDIFGTSWICMQKVPGTCTWQYNATMNCNFSNMAYEAVPNCNAVCADVAKAFIAGCSTGTVCKDLPDKALMKMRFRLTVGGKDCYGNFQWISFGSCSSGDCKSIAD